MTFSLSAKSQTLIMQVHPDLQKLMFEAIKHSPIEFIITEGLRTSKRQQELLAAKKTMTLNSRHIGGFACDIAVIDHGKMVSNPAPYIVIAKHIKAVAKELGISIRWGGDFKDAKGRPWFDGCHIELSKSKYPAK